MRRTIIFTLLVLLHSGCTSQQEKEAEKLYLDALSLESRGTYEDLNQARAIYSRIRRDYQDTKWSERASDRIFATGDQWAAGHRIWLMEQDQKAVQQAREAFQSTTRFP